MSDNTSKNTTDRIVVMPDAETAEMLKKILEQENIFMSHWYTLSDAVKKHKADQRKNT